MAAAAPAVAAAAAPPPAAAAAGMAIITIQSPEAALLHPHTTTPEPQGAKALIAESTTPRKLRLPELLEVAAYEAAAEQEDAAVVHRRRTSAADTEWTSSMYRFPKSSAGREGKGSLGAMRAQQRTELASAADGGRQGNSRG